MLNKYPLWKYLLLLAVLAIGLIYAAPNLYPPDPAVQISADNSSVAVDEALVQLAASALDRAGIEHFAAGVNDNGRSALLRVKDQESQLRAQRIIQRALGDDYIVALNLAATTPEWLRSFGAQPMKLGLDLSGGVHFLLEVDVEETLQKRLKTAATQIKRKLREEKIRGAFVKQLDDGRIEIRFKDEAQRQAVSSLVRKEFPNLQRLNEEREDRVYMYVSFSETEVKSIVDYAVGQNLTTLRNRVNELGVAEPLVQRQGRNRIVVELPGVQDTAQAKKIIGKTANLEFRLEAAFDATAATRERFEFRDAGSRRDPYAWLERDVVITGERVANAQPNFDENGRPQVDITLDGEGGTSMHRATRKNVGRNLGVLFIERKSRTTGHKLDEHGVEQPVRVSYDEKKIISLATIQSALGVSFRITGLDSPAEASELALLLRAGALAAPIEFVEERTVGPSLGAENIALGVRSVQIGLALVAIFMLFYYRVFGIFAVTALSANLVLLIAAMSALSATLTLPGIAGIVLTVGMAVDANVLIFSRIREELKNRLTPQQAIEAGYNHAFSTIMDANITTLIVAVILYAVGTGSIRGFAVTLSIGILTSMFTAIMGTRALANLTYGGRKLDKLSI